MSSCVGGVVKQYSRDIIWSCVQFGIVEAVFFVVGFQWPVNTKS